MVRESDTSIYAIGIYAGGFQVLPEEERGGPKLLTDIAEESGGRQFAVSNAGELADAARKIGSELRKSTSWRTAPPTRRRLAGIRIKVTLAERRTMHLSWRRGYYAPNR